MSETEETYKITMDNEGFTVKKEEVVVLKLLQYNYDDDLEGLLKDSDINWITVLGYLAYHRVAGLIYEKVNAVNIRLLDYPVFFAVYMINQAQRIRALEQNKYLLAISRTLCEKQIKHAFLKGSVLSNTMYTYGSRGSNDIDVLVSKKDLKETTELLKQLGFVQGKFDYKRNSIDPFTKQEIEEHINTKGETAPFVLVTDGIAIRTIDVDVNYSLDWSPNMAESTVEAFLADRIRIETQEHEKIYALSYEHNLMELCIHLYKDSALIDIIKKRKVLDLYKFVDIYYYLMQNIDKMDIEKLYNEIKRFAMEKQIGFALSYVYALFPDVRCKSLDALMDKLNFDEEIMNKIFDQYDESVSMSIQSNLIDRIFSYDLINRYKE